LKRVLRFAHCIKLCGAVVFGIWLLASRLHFPKLIFTRRSNVSSYINASGLQCRPAGFNAPGLFWRLGRGGSRS